MLLLALVVVVGRGEVLLGMNGVINPRDAGLLPLLYAEQGINRAVTGGQKRVNPFLSNEDRMCLERLPAIGPTMDSVIDCYLAIAREFIPRAKALADRTGERWPTELERATVDHVERSLGARVIEDAARN